MKRFTKGSIRSGHGEEFLAGELDVVGLGAVGGEEFELDFAVDVGAEKFEALGEGFSGRGCGVDFLDEEAGGEAGDFGGGLAKDFRDADFLSGAEFERDTEADDFAHDVGGGFAGEGEALKDGPADGFDGERFAGGGENDDAAVLFFVEADPGVVTARATGVPEQFHSGRLIGAAVGPSHGGVAEEILVGNVGQAVGIAVADDVRAFHEWGQGRGGESSVGGGVFQEIIGGGENAASGGEGLKFPRRARFAGIVVSHSEVEFRFGREGEARVIHVQRAADAIHDEGFEVSAGLERDSVAEEGGAEIGVFEFGARVTGELVLRKEGIHLLNGERFILLLSVFAGHFGIEGQSGGVSGEIEEGDLFAAVSGKLNGGGEIFGDGIVEAHFAALNHVLQEKHGECFGDRADEEDGVGIDGIGDTVVERAGGEDLAAVFIDEADDDGGVGVGEIVVEELLDGRGVGEAGLGADG